MDRLQIIVGDIFEMNADALIFPANPLPEVGGSLDRIVYEKAGWDSLLEARKEIGVLKSTESKITKALKLHTKPIYWQSDKIDERWALFIQMV